MLREYIAVWIYVHRYRDSIREEVKEELREELRAKLEKRELEKLIISMSRNGISTKQIAEITQKPLQEIQDILQKAS